MGREVRSAPGSARSSVVRVPVPSPWLRRRRQRRSLKIGEVANCLMVMTLKITARSGKNALFPVKRTHKNALMQRYAMLLGNLTRGNTDNDKKRSFPVDKRTKSVSVRSKVPSTDVEGMRMRTAIPERNSGRVNVTFGDTLAAGMLSRVVSSEGCIKW